MNGLQERYGSQIDFFHLDIDQSITKNVRDRYGITGRTQYVLLDADGNIVEQWYGPLSSVQVSMVLDEYLASLDTVPG